jgi:uncharacterized protein
MILTASSTRTSTESTDPVRTEPATDEAPDARSERRPKRPFSVHVASLRKESGTTRHEIRSGAIEGLAAVGVSVPDAAPVTCDLTLSSYPGGIMVTGTVRAPWVGECRRCGGPVAGTVEAAVRERYAPGDEHRADGDEEAYPLVGEELDLEPLACDAVLLDLPLAPLCSPDCRGLCPRCGQNWNVAACTCSPETDPRWSALDALRGPEVGGLA